ncbi:MAG TPA: lipopolysaccharide biosynthesis protein [Tepidisphaeraceae bacterium]
MRPRSDHQALSHAAIYLVARGLPGAIAFLAIPLFSRLLAPADYGRYALVVATVSLLNALLFQWLRLSLLRYLPAYRDDPGRLKSTLTTVTGLLLTVLGILAAVACATPIPAEWRGVLVAGWVLLATQAVFEQCCEYARSSIRPGRYMALQVTKSTLAIGVGVGLVLLGARWWGPLGGMVCGMAIGAVWAYRADWRDVRWVVDRRVLAEVCRYGIPLSLTVALAVVIESSDRFLIAWWSGQGAAGLYAVSVDFASQTLTLLMLSVSMAMFPLAVREWEQEGPQGAQEQMRTNASLLLAVGVPCVVGLVVLAPGIANCFLGKEFRATAALIIPVVAVGTFLAGLKAYHFDAAFQFAHRTIWQVWIVLFAAILNVALNLVAIPRWGVAGAAGVAVITYLITTVLTAWLGRRHFVVPWPMGSCGQVAVAAGAMAVVIVPFRGFHGGIALAGQVMAGAVVYGLMLVGMNFLGLRDAVIGRLRRRCAVEARGGGVVAPLVETR